MNLPATGKNRPRNFQSLESFRAAFPSRWKLPRRRVPASGIFLHAAALLALGLAARATPVLFTAYENTWTVPSAGSGTNYYGDAWGTSNFPATTIFHDGSLSNAPGGGSVPTLTSSSFGQPLPNTLFDFAIGEDILPPIGVITNLPPVGFVPRRAGDNSNAYYVSVNPPEAAIFIPSLGKVVAGVGGALEVKWQNGTTNPTVRAYNISSIPKTRPNRIFWTEDPYRGPPIDLRVNQQEVYAVFHTNSIVHGPVYGPEVVQGGNGTITNNALIRGVLHDQTLNQLRVTRVAGLALIEYYRDANFRESLGVTPVQVLRPDQKIISASIGDRLLPEDLFYGTDDLTADIVAGLNEEKVYKHDPQSETAPKRGFVFAQRRNVTAPWEVEIFWKQTDFRGVLWPFESDWYAQDWPTNAPVYVVTTNLAYRAPVIVTNPTLLASVPYQEVAGNATVANGTILASKPGRFLLKYSTDENVWFEVIEAVDRADARFSASPLPWAVGDEVTSIVLTNFRGDVLNADFPGFLYTPYGTAYDVNLYRYPDATNANSDSQIFGVNALAGKNLLEAWFAAPGRISDLPATLYFPGHVQRVELAWPTNAPQIVIASEEGSLGDQLPGRPEITFPAGSLPTVYVQNNPALHGYNPNEEHALAINETVFALRDDLNISSSSPPFVVVEFVGTNLLGEPRMDVAVLEVVRTNAIYPQFGSGALAVPIILQPPMPLTVLPQAFNNRNQVVNETGSPVNPASQHPVAFRDRKKQWWAKAAGAAGGSTNLQAQYFYALQDGFVFPGDPTPVSTGDLVPWLSGSRTGTPVNYPYVLNWPSNAPQLALAQTLTDSPANSGLPSVADQLSAQIVFQQSVQNGGGVSAILFDPTVRRGMSTQNVIRSVQMDRNWFSVDKVGQVELSEPGGSKVLAIRMTRQPASTVTLNFAAHLPSASHITISPASLTFTTADYANPHFLTITSVDDALQDGLYTHQLVGDASGSAPGPGAGALVIPLLQHDNDSGVAQSLIDTLEAAGKAVRRSPGRTYTFPDVSPALGSRLTFDPDQPSYRTLSIIGQRVGTLTSSYLLGNWLRDDDRTILLSFTNVLGTVDEKAAWVQAVQRLPAQALTLTDDGTPHDSLALTATSDNGTQGTGFVTLVFNNSENADMVSPALPVSMSVIQVVPELYPGALAVLPADNALDEKLTIRQQNDYAAKVDQYEFEWRTLPPTTEGLQPATPFGQWLAYSSGTGLDQITISGASLQTIADNYFVSRYRPLNQSGPTGATWSDWSLAFAPGWVQRAVNGINPYEQRFTDTAANSINPANSMIEIAGGPYNGPVALNPDAVEEAGLIEIYETIIERARMLSIDANFDYGPANSALLLAASRLFDLYMLLGNEAYADASDPTIGFGSDDVTYGRESTHLFAFMNQVPTLLDEELALLRGRDNTFAPSPQQGPAFNRLPWNFTRGIDGGEVAYALNYNIVGAGTSVVPQITVTDAARLYPQGHGDAWGHYLSAIRGYYRLLQHTNFTWIPGVGAQLLGGSGDLIVNVDYKDEQKFADAAAARARTGAETVNLTYRKFHSLEATPSFDAYRDEDGTRAWGVADWASRAGQGAYYDWAMANSLLPTVAAAATRDWALVFTSATSRADTGPFNFTPESGVSYELWIKPESVTGTLVRGILTSDRSFSATDTRRLELSINATGTIGVTVETGISTGSYDATVSIDTNWHHVVLIEAQMTDSTKQFNLYIDGVNRTPAPMLLTEPRATGINVALGAAAASNAAFSGQMDDVRVWKKALSVAEITTRMNMHLTGREDSLVTWYPMLAGSGATLFDQASVRNAFAHNIAWATPTATGGGFRPPEPNLPEGAAFKGILELDRSTVPALREIAAQAGYIQQQLDNVDVGLNPMGLARDAIPFDIAPTDPGSHFEQIYDRALVAVQNASVLFDRAAGTTRRLREQFNANRDLDDDLARSELDYHNRLIEIYGYPYTDDIGPTGSYPQGYDGPDLIHYAYVDFADIGLDLAIGDVSTVTVTNLGLSWTARGSTSSTVFARSDWEDWGVRLTSAGTTTHTYAISEQGFVLKPPSWTGQRRAAGRIQQAYASYLKSYYQLNDASTAYQDALFTLKLNFTKVQQALSTAQGEYDDYSDLLDVRRAALSLSFVSELGQLVWDAGEKIIAATAETLAVTIPEIETGTAGLGPFYSTHFKFGDQVSASVRAAPAVAFTALSLVKAGALSTKFAEELMSLDLENLVTENGYRNELRWMILDLDSSTTDQFNKLNLLRAALIDFQQHEQEFRSIQAEGERIIQERMLIRGQAGRQVQQQRYSDLAFRLFRDDRLSKYRQSFDLAARYVHLAAKAYDYETGLLSDDEDSEAGDNFLSDIARARTLGLLDASGNPQPADGNGDPGLSDIMARMAANWDVVKGRFGINNPQRVNSHVSLRTELFRIQLQDALGASDEAWKQTLTTLRVADLNTVPEYRRYCRPVSSNLVPEPGIVIPFSTTIEAGKNLFGHPLAGGDHSFASGHAATRFRSAAIYLYNYDSLALAVQPQVYLVPVGADTLRSPTDTASLRTYNVVEQTLPIPYPVVPGDLDLPGWNPIVDTLPTGFTSIRRHATFQAFPENNTTLYQQPGTETAIGPYPSARLIGRTVWNNRWLLIIPGRTLLADPDEGLNRLIYGTGTGTGPATRTGNGIKDIRLYLDTYSVEGE